MNLISKGQAIFLDTSILITKLVGSPVAKSKIDNQINNFDISISSLVVWQEFKRRFLKEALYLYKLLKDLESYTKVLRHIIDVLPHQQHRKRNICLETLVTIDERDDDADRTDRLYHFLKYLLRGNKHLFENLVEHVIKNSNCACAKQPIIIKNQDKFEFGTKYCKQLESSCGVDNFLKENELLLKEIQLKLKKLLLGDKPGEKSNELEKIEDFINEYFINPDKIKSKNPCLTVGDLLIALESSSINNFYTKNSKDSQHLCKILKQNLFIRPNKPENNDTVCDIASNKWPKF